jgi:hypothetical protein
MLVSKCSHIGTLEKPLCGLVLHFGEGGPSSRPCEASWVGVPSFRGVDTPPVRVYVSRSSLNTMRAVYAPLGHRVIVEPLFFNEAELDAEAFLSMMAVDSSESAPLYVQLILVRIHTLQSLHLTHIFLVNPPGFGRELYIWRIYGSTRRLQDEL